MRTLPSDEALRQRLSALVDSSATVEAARASVWTGAGLSGPLPVEFHPKEASARVAAWGMGHGAWVSRMDGGHGAWGSMGHQGAWGMASWGMGHGASWEMGHQGAWGMASWGMGHGALLGVCLWPQLPVCHANLRPLGPVSCSRPPTD